jgi:endoglycosylceramidase
MEGRTVRLIFAFFTGIMIVCLPACNASKGEGTADSGVDAGADGGWSYPVLHVDGRNIVDEHGRVVMLRGINVGGRSKMPPFIPWEGDPQDASFDSDMKRFFDFPADWGLNCFRLTVFWEAVEPERGVYDEKYLAFVGGQIKAAADRGVYVFIDFHQDLFSRWLGGSGAPRWAIKDPPAAAPPLNDSGWFMKVFSDQKVLGAFDRFWGNEDGIQDAYIGMAAMTAGRFKGSPNVIGMDIMNEPNPGSLGKKDMHEWYAGKLIPFFKRAAAEIRKSAPGFIVFLEPSGTEAGESGSQEWTVDGLENYVLAPHYYYPMQFISGTYDGNIAALREAVAEKDKFGKDLGVPVLMSEYGFRGAEGDAGKDENAGRYIRDYQRVLDENLMHGTIWSHEVSSTYWNREDCSFVNGDWTERVPRADALSRPYPEFTSGAPVSFVYDSIGKRVEYKYSVRGVGGRPTVIRLPGRHFPKEPEVGLAFGRWEHSAARSILLVYDGDAAEGAAQTVAVSP